MIVASDIESILPSLREARSRGLAVGLVPTMGALHAGHVSLMRAVREEIGFVVVSIFVNPTQFGPAEDFDCYPRPLDSDLKTCEANGVDLVFHPDAKTMYPPGFQTLVEVKGLQDVLCGASRPGHFRGVATVVLKLFNIIQPEVAYFGQKDAQQVRIIRRMVDDLNVPVRVRVCPTVREPDGLAISSRNQYLDEAQRTHARALFQGLREVLASRIAATPGAELGYAAVVDADTLKPVRKLKGEVLVALAVKFGTTRLIDNLSLTV
jgi:pantoate--beta-alanine ligase